jgi:hypothetical protein
MAGDWTMLILDRYIIAADPMGLACAPVLQNVGNLNGVFIAILNGSGKVQSNHLLKHANH